MKKTILQLAFIILAVNVIFISGANAATVSCNGSQSDCQTKVTAASDKDTILIPSGSYNWASSISWTDKNINVVGAGIGVTNITITAGATAFRVTDTTKSSFRISGMTINMPTANAGGYASGYILVFNYGGTIVRSGWRIDHIRFNSTITSGGGNHPITIIGLTWGLIDHCTFDDNGWGEQSISHYAIVGDSVEAPGGQSCSAASANCGKYSWEYVALGLGTDSAVYVEDCTFNHSTTGASAVNDTQYGGRMVIRHNTIYNSMVMTHSAWGPVRGGMKLEVYNNTFTSNLTPTGNYRPALIRSGTGVFFNNTISGNYVVKSLTIDNQRSCLPMPTLCDGRDSTYDKNTSGQNGWPCEDQPGVGSGAWKSQTLEPWYAWNNGTYQLVESGCSPLQVQSGRDFFNNGTTPKPGYTPYTYPHPLTMPNPNPPRNLRIGN